MKLVTTVGSDQISMIADIIELHVPRGRFELDPTYNRGGFYKDGRVLTPTYLSDIDETIPGIGHHDARELPHEDSSVSSIMFDPPFLAGPGVNGKPGRFSSTFTLFPSIDKLWVWYSSCMAEFSRVLNKGGVLVIKCQDTVSNHRQRLSHVYLINEGERVGLVCCDLFVLTTSTRPHQHNQKNQYHARKYHSYFLVLKKGRC